MPAANKRVCLCDDSADSDDPGLEKDAKVRHIARPSVRLTAERRASGDEFCTRVLGG